jgi:flagellar protein FlaG
MTTITNVNQSSAAPLTSERLSANAAPQPVRAAAPAQSANPVTPAVETVAAVNREQVSNAVEKINQTIQSASQGVVFNLNNDFNRLIVTVVDQETNEVIRQIPSEEVLEIARSLDKLQGLLIKQTA